MYSCVIVRGDFNLMFSHVRLNKRTTFFDRVLWHLVDPPASNAAVAFVCEKSHVQPLRVGVLVEDTGRGVFVCDSNLFTREVARYDVINIREAVVLPQHSQFPTAAAGSSWWRKWLKDPTPSTSEWSLPLQTASTEDIILYTYINKFGTTSVLTWVGGFCGMSVKRMASTLSGVQ